MTIFPPRPPGRIPHPTPLPWKRQPRTALIPKNRKERKP